VGAGQDERGGAVGVGIRDLRPEIRDQRSETRDQKAGVRL
jgi:hypothetical protein